MKVFKKCIRCGNIKIRENDEKDIICDMCSHIELGKHDVEEPTAWNSVKLNRFDDVTKAAVSIPADLVISDEVINKLLSTSDLMKELNELIIKDTNERYVRELLNRIHKAIDELEKHADFGLYASRDRKIIDILMGVEEDVD